MMGENGVEIKLRGRDWAVVIVAVILSVGGCCAAMLSS